MALQKVVRSSYVNHWEPWVLSGYHRIDATATLMCEFTFINCIHFLNTQYKRDISKCLNSIQNLYIDVYEICK